MLMKVLKDLSTCELPRVRKVEILGPSSMFESFSPWILMQCEYAAQIRSTAL